MGYDEEMDELEPHEPTDRDRAMVLVEEWRDNADALEAFPGLIRWINDPETFERELYEAKCVLDGIVFDALDMELYAEFGQDGEDE